MKEKKKKKGKEIKPSGDTDGGSESWRREEKERRLL